MEIGRNFSSLPKDIFSRFFHYLSLEEQKKLASTSKVIKRNYVEFIKTTCRERAGVTRLYPYQSEILKWIIERMEGNAQLLCNTFMSSGKTLMGYETCMRLLKKNNKALCLILVPANVIRVWIDEAKKHYPSFVEKPKKILFYHSVRKADCLSIDKAKSNRGKIIVSTPNTVPDVLVDKASYVLFDETHKLVKSVKEIADKKKNVPCLYFTASAYTDKRITDTYTLNSDNAIFPKISFRFIELAPITKIPGMAKPIPPFFKLLKKDLIGAKDKHMAFLTSSVFPVSDFENLADIEIWDFNNRQTTYYDKFKKKGGAIVSTLRVISEGNNLNHCSRIYILDPSLCKFITLRQVVGRFYRQSNKNSSIEIIFITEFNTINWARCKLSTVDIDLKGYDAKITKSIININKFLVTNGYNLDTLSEQEIICLYANNEENIFENKDLEKFLSRSVVKTIKQEHLLRCMLY